MTPVITSTMEITMAVTGLLINVFAIIRQYLLTQKIYPGMVKAFVVQSTTFHRVRRPMEVTYWQL